MLWELHDEITDENNHLSWEEICGTLEEISDASKEHDAAIARTATLAADIKWSTALNTLIATESKRKDKESVDMVYSYRIAQVIESLRQQAEEARQ